MLSIGIGGQTSPMIAVRQGGVPVSVAVTGGIIPATGTVGVSPAVNLFYINATTGTRTQHGYLAGVPGVLRLVKTTGGVYTYTFERTSQDSHRPPPRVHCSPLGRNGDVA